MADFLLSKRGFAKISFNGYMYTKHHDGETELTWRCVKRGSLKCNGIAKSDLDKTNMREVKPHCHSSNHEEVKLHVVRQEMKIRAQQTTDKPNQVA